MVIIEREVEESLRNDVYYVFCNFYSSFASQRTLMRNSTVRIAWGGRKNSWWSWPFSFHDNSSQDGLDYPTVTTNPKHLSSLPSQKFFTHITICLCGTSRSYLCSPSLVRIQAHRRFLSIHTSTIIVAASSTSAQPWHMLLSLTFHRHSESYVST